MRSLCLLLISVLAAAKPSLVYSEPQECTQRKIIANVTLRNGSLLRGLRPNSFVATFRGEQIPINDVEEERSPRRIAFVVDTGSLDRDVRRAEHHIVSSILQEARAEDSFALTTVRGIRRQVQFGSDREIFELALIDILNPPRESSRAKDLLPTIQEVLSSSDLQAGDGIFVIARDFEFSEEKFAELLVSLMQRGIRVYAFQLGPTMAGEYWHVWQLNGGFRLGNESTLKALAWNSGGYILVSAPWSGQHSFKFTPERADFLRAASINSYKAITQYYQIRFQPPQLKLQENWVLDVVPSIKEQAKQVVVLYPRLLQPCESSRAEKRP